MRRIVAPLVAALAWGCGGAAPQDVLEGTPTPTTNGDAGRDATSVAEGGTDAGGTDAAKESGAGSTVACGRAACSVGAQVCCRTPPTDDKCAAASDCPGGNLAIPCDEGSDCAALGVPGGVCCVTATTSGASEVSCRPSSDCRRDQGRTTLCDPRAANPCPNGGSCRPSAQTLPGYTLCIN